MGSENEILTSEIKFKPCKTIMQNDILCFVWPISEQSLNEIRDYLALPDLNLSFNSTLERMPPFCCPKCGVDITFFDVVRYAVESGTHTVDFLIEAMGKKIDRHGKGMRFQIDCKNGHKQPVLLGWAAGFGWTYNQPEHE